LEIVFASFLFNIKAKEIKKSDRNKINPIYHAGIPKNNGQVSPKAQVSENNLTPLA
jgi:hypothetical protein